MARSPNPQDRVVGSFVEKEYGKTFEYKLNPETGTIFNFLIYVGPGGAETRAAMIKKTVAYVVVDEGIYGATLEKWNIKKHVRYS